ERIQLRQPVTFDTLVPNLRRDWLEAYPKPNGPDAGAGMARFTAQTMSPASITTGSLRVDRSLGSTGTMFARYTRAPSTSESGFLQRIRSQFTSQTFTAGVITVTGGGRITNDARVGVSGTVVGSEWRPGQ